MHTNGLPFQVWSLVEWRAIWFFLRFPVPLAVMRSAWTFSQRHVGQMLQRQGYFCGWQSLVVGVWLSLAPLFSCWASPAAAAVAGLAHAPIVAETRTQRVEARASGTVSLETLPALEKRVYQLIWQGGPFPYVKDGMVFANRERLLPPKTRGFYREYTVASPHARTRGARRFVCGGPRRSPEVCYYTADHYASFQKIVP